jgi:ribulose-5-phosphate 4-epimerase/fuculose-1-phosphate aldolase|tara:strand:- start:64 stop:558 length:495 start_codon:yes stop_codon:yes gene_type:complete
MIIDKKKFMGMQKEHREQMLGALFQAEHQNFTKKQIGVDIDVPIGYSVRAAVILECELPDEIVKKIFVIEHDANSFIKKIDIDNYSEYAAQMAKTKIFVPERDDLFVITPSGTPYEEYKKERGKLVFVDLDSILKGVNEHYNNNRELRDVLRHYGFVQEREAKF